MADVFRAIAFGASGFERTIALKVLRREFVGDSTLERMFAEEARLQAQLTHRCLVAAHDTGVADGLPWVRLDYMNGGALEGLLTRAGPLSEALGRRIGAEIALGLHVLHQAHDEQQRQLGLVHRDVTVSNVLLTMEGEVKLADFGIARATLMRQQTRGGIRKGTANAMSPEQVAGERLTSASDIFSLAGLVIELLTCHRPFESATTVETLDRIRAATQPTLDGVPPALKAILTQALQREPHVRPSALQLRAALLTGAADELELAAFIAQRSQSHGHESLPSPPVGA